MIRVLIVDDQALIREGLKMMLSINGDIEVIGEAVNGLDAIEKTKQLTPDVILMDIKMPIMNGVEATKVIKGANEKVKIIILTTFNEEEFIFKGLRNGAEGYILKDVKAEEIIKAIKTVYSGNVLLQPEVATKLVKKLTEDKESEEKVINGIDKMKELTPREMELAKLVAQGKSNREICEILFLTEGTVKNHISRILGKLDLRDRTQLAICIKEKMDM